MRQFKFLLITSLILALAPAAYSQGPVRVAKQVKNVNELGNLGKQVQIGVEEARKIVNLPPNTAGAVNIGSVSGARNSAAPTTRMGEINQRLAPKQQGTQANKVASGTQKQPKVKTSSSQTGKVFQRMDALGKENPEGFFFDNTGKMTDAEFANFKAKLMSGKYPLAKYMPDVISLLSDINIRDVRKVILRNKKTDFSSIGFIVHMGPMSIFIDNGFATLTTYKTDPKEGVIISNYVTKAHTTDTHSNIAYIAAELRTFVKQRGHPVVLLDGGDAFDTEKYEEVLTIINKLNYAFMTYGNHEGDWLLEKFKEIIDGYNGNLLSFNIVDKYTDEVADFMLPYARINVNGMNFVIVGAGKLGRFRGEIAVEDLPKIFERKIIPNINPEDVYKARDVFTKEIMPKAEFMKATQKRVNNEHEMYAIFRQKIVLPYGKKDKIAQLSEDFQNYLFLTAPRLKEVDIKESFNKYVRPNMQEGDYLIVLAHSSAFPGGKAGNLPLRDFIGLWPAEQTDILGGHEHILSKHNPNHPEYADFNLGGIAYTESGANGEGFSAITFRSNPETGERQSVERTQYRKGDHIPDAEMFNLVKKFEDPADNEIVAIASAEISRYPLDNVKPKDRAEEFELTGELDLTAGHGYIPGSLMYEYFIDNFMNAYEAQSKAGILDPDMDFTRAKINDAVERGRLIVVMNSPSMKNAFPAGNITRKQLRDVRPCITGSGGEEFLALTEIKGVDLLDYLTVAERGGYEYINNLGDDKVRIMSPQLEVKYKFTYNYQNSKKERSYDRKIRVLTPAELKENNVSKRLPALRPGKGGQAIDPDEIYLMLTSTNNVGNYKTGDPGRQNENIALQGIYLENIFIADEIQVPATKPGQTDAVMQIKTKDLYPYYIEKLKKGLPKGQVPTIHPPSQRLYVLEREGFEKNR